MKNIKVIIAVIVIVALIAIGIYFGTKGKESEEVNTSSQEVSIENFKNVLQNKGLTVTEVTPKVGAMIGADEGYGYKINGTSIEIYKFNEESNNELTKSNIDKAKNQGIIVMPDFNNMEIKGKYNKGLLLVNYEGHPNEDEIVSAFNSL